MPKKKSTRKRAQPRPRARRDEDIIDVEAEPVAGEGRPAPPPIVVEVQAGPDRVVPMVADPRHPRGTPTIVSLREVRAVVKEVEDAAAVGREIGEFLAGLLRR